ncbi:MAG: sigma-70 family RNA polymerase sigma factor [Gemmatimonadetes bacterium]|nr:sigma-70 family RNA polymerase sigma factor [Gemmatimonadota bacterium]MYC71378.1 sigma-70 family RNA polymerase sigma factor [Gemmatimonadota bacterium]MYI63300.1 sigma-70 family RNA polymerase sigma factor [Gemmatimonadota bacterium]
MGTQMVYDYDELAALTKAAQDGDVRAYGRIVELTRNSVEAAARVIVHNPEDAEDIAQETYLRAFGQLDNLQDAASLLAWLQRIARNLALNRRRANRWSFVSDLDMSQIAQPEIDADELGPALARALVGLGGEDRQLCERYYHGGWTTARLAGEMKISESAVRKRLQRVRERLRKGIAMHKTDLPERIVELLSKPNLTALPENPVGAVWEAFKRQYDGFTEVELAEKIDPDKVREIFADAGNGSLEEYLTAASRQQWLRRELTMPMVVEAVGREAPVRLISTGKTYRIDDEESSTRLHAFHQAEVLWIGEGLSEWQLMAPFSEFIRELNPDMQLRIQHFDYSLYCERGWEIAAQLQGTEWSSIAGLGRLKADLLKALGFDSNRLTAVGLGLGLERLAMMLYGIDDIRRIGAERV